jgi:beta-lactamase class A
LQSETRVIEQPVNSGQPSPPRFRRALLAALVLIVSGGLLSACGSQNGPSQDLPTSTITADVALVVTPIFTVPPTETPIPTSTPTIPPTPEFIDGIPTSPEQAAATALLQGEQGVYGVVVLGPDGKVVVTRNAHVPFVTASTYKLVLMADILSKVEAGELSLEQTYTLEQELFTAGDGDMFFANDEAGTEATLEDLLFAAGAYSSNVAGLTMLKLTSPESLRQTAEKIGMNETWLLADPASLPNWPPQVAPDAAQADVDAARDYIESSAELGPVNITTPFDMATYMQKLSTNTLISPFVSEQIMRILEEQLIGDRIPLLLPDGYESIDKPGNLEDVVNDVGFITLPSGEIRPLALLTLGLNDDDRATQVEQRLALIAAGVFDIPPYDDTTQATPAA